MSSEQASLSDVADLSADKSERGAVYGRKSPVRPESRGVRRKCLECGNDVPGHVARVMGDNNECVPACPECSEQAVRWLAAIRIGRGSDSRDGGDSR